VTGVRACGQGNVVRVDLAAGVGVDLDRLERHFYTSSSCGVCGKASLKAVQVCARHRLAEGLPVTDGEVIYRLPGALRAAQYPALGHKSWTCSICPVDPCWALALARWCRAVQELYKLAVQASSRIGAPVERSRSGSVWRGRALLIERAVKATEFDGQRSAKNPAFVNAVARKNVDLTMALLLEKSAVLRDLQSNKVIKVAGAMYDLETATVEFFA
jgi:hypothetical protein